MHPPLSKMLAIQCPKNTDAAVFIDLCGDALTVIAQVEYLDASEGPGDDSLIDLLSSYMGRLTHIYPSSPQAALMAIKVAHAFASAQRKKPDTILSQDFGVDVILRRCLEVLAPATPTDDFTRELTEFVGDTTAKH